MEQVKNQLKTQPIETPSWAYTDHGTRFQVFHNPGSARNVFEKLADAAYINSLTGVAPSIMLDQNQNVEGKLQAVLISILNCQSAYTKALIVDYDRLHQRQLQGDMLGAHRLLFNAYETDIRPLLAQVRLEQGLPADPIAYFRNADYERRIAAERG